MRPDSLQELGSSHSGYWYAVHHMSGTLSLGHDDVTIVYHNRLIACSVILTWIKFRTLSMSQSCSSAGRCCATLILDPHATALQSSAPDHGHAGSASPPTTCKKPIRRLRALIHDSSRSRDECAAVPERAHDITAFKPGSTLLLPLRARLCDYSLTRYDQRTNTRNHHVST